MNELNEKRQKLPGSRKIIIYCDKVFYLMNKWYNVSIDLNLIGIKRIQEYKCNDYLDN